MKGTHIISAARLNGSQVQAVSIDFLTDDLNESGLTPDGRGRVFVEPMDDGASLDLRCCHGTKVYIHGRGDPRTFDVFERVKEFAPSSIAVAFSDSVVLWNKRDGASQRDG